MKKWLWVLISSAMILCLWLLIYLQSWNKETAYKINHFGKLTRIVLQKDSQNLVLKKQDDVWYLPSHDKVNPAVFQDFLGVIADIALVRPADTSLNKEACLHLAFYAENQLVMDYYLAWQENNDLYTYFAYKDSPFYLAQDAYTLKAFGKDIAVQALDWLDKTVFFLQEDTLQSVSVHYASDSTRGYFLQKKDNNWTLQNLQGKDMVLYPQDAYAYLGFFSYLQFEKPLNQAEQLAFHAFQQKNKPNVLLQAKTDHAQYAIDFYDFQQNNVQNQPILLVGVYQNTAYWFSYFHVDRLLKDIAFFENLSEMQ
jgi:hypothetical protein